MKKLLGIAAVLLLCVSTSSAQTTPTPNIGLEIPSNGSTNWNLPLNFNFNLLDQLLGGKLQPGGFGLAPAPVFGTGAPTLACTVGVNQGQEYFDTAAGFALYVCNAGVWNAAGGSGGAVLPSNALVFGLTSSTSRAALPSDVATLLASLGGCSTSNFVYSPANGNCVNSAGAPGGSTGQTQYKNSGGTFSGYTPSGDFTIDPTTGIATVVDTNGVPFGALATESLATPAQGGTGFNSSAAIGVAQVASGTWSISTALANGTTATTQSPGDNTIKIATTAFVLANAGVGSVTHTAGALTAHQIMVGNGGADATVDPDASTDGAGNITAASVSAGGFIGSCTTCGPATFQLPYNTGTIGTLLAGSTGFAGPSSPGTTPWVGFLNSATAAGLAHAASPTTIAGVNGSQITWSGVALADLTATGTPSSATFLRGDNTWATPSGGTVTSVGFTGGLISVANPTTTPAFTVAGTSGGIPYFSSASTWATSAALPSGDFILGGGAGSSPTASFAIVPASKGGFGIDTSGSTGCPVDTAGSWAVTACSTGTVTAVSIATANGFSGSSSGGSTPALTIVAGAITPSSVLATGIVDGTAPVTITTSSTATLGGTYKSGYTINNDGATAVTYTLPTAAAGLQYCAFNIAGATGTLELLTSASGQFIDNAGTYTATGGYIISGGALGDAACVTGIDSTHWKLWIQGGTWTTH